MNAVPNADRVREDRTRAEMWFCKHLWDKTGVDVQRGVTSSAERMKRICALIAEKGLTDQIMGRFNGRDETYAAFAKRALGVDLAAPQEALF